MITIQEHIALAPLTTLQVGGAARYFAEARNAGEVCEALAFASAQSVPLFVLGGGSNLVVSDAGWRGLVLKVAVGGIETEDSGDTAIFRAGAGVDWDDFVAQAVARNCSGVECLSGIPGSVGGTPVQNVGAYGQEVADTIVSVTAFDIHAGRIVEMPASDCGFRYRSSIFNTTQRGRYVILSVSFRLAPGGGVHLEYGDLQQHFAGSGRVPSLAEVRNAVRDIRRNKGMLLVPGDPDCRSAGSFFKNPILPGAQFADLVRRAAARNLQVPHYPAADAQNKVSAAWLVEHSGFRKGFTLGNAAISSRHALAIINRGNAQTADIIRLKDRIQNEVRDAWGIQLEPEPVFVGF